MESDDNLIARLKGGDRLALQTLYARHNVKIYRFVLRLVRDEAAAKDVVSEVFIDFWRNPSALEGRLEVSTGLMAIARNKAWSLRRKKKDGEIEDDALGAIEDERDDPKVVAQKKGKSELLRACLERLGAERREAIDLVYYHDKTIEEVAAIVGVPESAVKTRMLHARTKLSEIARAAGIDRGWPVMAERDDDLSAIEELLPWYAADALSAGEKRRVEEALAREPKVRASLETIREDLEETIALNQALPGPRPAALNKIMAAVAAEPRRAGALGRLTGLAERMTATISQSAVGSPRAFAYAVFVAALIVIGQGAAIVSLLPHAGSTASTASQERTATSEGAFLLVGFAPDATAQQIEGLLLQKKAVIVDGPRGGLFRIRIGDKALSKEQRDAALAAWRAETTVRTALPAPAGER